MERRGCGDIYVSQNDPGNGNHHKGQLKDFIFTGGCFFFMALHGGVGMDDTAHADHVDVKVFEKQNVVGKVGYRLPRQADHDACPDPKPNGFKGLKAFDARFEGLLGRMYARK